MNFEYELNKQDYIELNLHNLTYSKPMRRTLFIQRYIHSLSFIIIPFLLFRITSISLTFWLVCFGMFYLLWVLSYPKLVKHFGSKRMSKMFDAEKNKGMLGIHQLLVTEDGLVYRNQLKETKIKYEGIESVAEHKTYIFIYVNTEMALIVPVNIFTDEAQKRAFIEDIKKRVDYRGEARSV